MPSSDQGKPRKRKGASPKLFLTRFEEVGGTPLRPNKRRPLGSLIKTVVEELKISTAAIAQAVPLKDEIESYLQEAGVKFEKDASQVDLGVTGVSAAVGKTGSLIFAWEDSNSDHLLTSLPPVHLAVVEKERIFPSIEEAMEAVLARGKSYPYISVINGPSKTGDIELIHVNGVHGPQWVYAVVV